MLSFHCQSLHQQILAEDLTQMETVTMLRLT